MMMVCDDSGTWVGGGRDAGGRRRRRRRKKKKKTKQRKMVMKRKKSRSRGEEVCNGSHYLYYCNEFNAKEGKDGVPFSVMEVLILHLEPGGTSLPSGGVDDCPSLLSLPTLSASPGCHTSGPSPPHLAARRWVPRPPQYSILSPEPTVVAHTPRAQLHHTPSDTHTRVHTHTPCVHLSGSPQRAHASHTPQPRRQQQHVV